MQILIIQTAYIGDVVLATPLIEKLNEFFPTARIDFLLRKGNESLFDHHPILHQVIVWNKHQNKWRNLMRVAVTVRKQRYDLVVNVHRYFTSGLLTAYSGAEQKVGFKSNPWSLFFDRALAHKIDGRHEVERNLSLISDLTDDSFVKPKLYVKHVQDQINRYKNSPYITISPGSIWPTKRLPLEKWTALIRSTKVSQVFLLGGAQDVALCERLRGDMDQVVVTVLAGKLSMLESAALMQGATMNYVNDSAPLHFASAVNAPVTVAFCSTIPQFGFGPLSEKSIVRQSNEALACRPCGPHGHKQCPKGHFKCGQNVNLVK